MVELLPREIVDELNRYIVGQNNAKKAIAIALRNRWRRQRISSSLKNEIYPKNILMIGPTGVGKTEISRRLSNIAKAPFIKVEATKFTEVGYVGRDVEQIVRDLVNVAIQMEKEKKRREVKHKAEKSMEQRIIECLSKVLPIEEREIIKGLRNGDFDNYDIEIETEDVIKSPFSSFEIPGASIGAFDFSSILGKRKSKKSLKKIKVREAKIIILSEESEKMIDQSLINKLSVTAVQEKGIVFLDEIDKIASSKDGIRSGHGEVSREGVQRDLLPLIEGTIVGTKYGDVKTDHILFIASGSFHTTSPSDLLPELQGRLPIRVKLDALSKDDFIRILTETEASLIKQYTALFKTEGISLELTPAAIEKVAEYAEILNTTVENIGARRLYTIMEKIHEDLSFNAPDMKVKEYLIDEKYVEEKISSLFDKQDLSHFIL